MIQEQDTSSYNGNEVLNDAARRGDLAAVQQLMGGEPEWCRWVATRNALSNGRWAVVDVLLEAGVGEQGRNDLLEHVVVSGNVDMTERVLRDGTSEKARGSALNRLADWQRGAREGRSAELADEHHKCLLAVLAAGVAADDRRSALKKARANGDDLLAAWLAD